MIMHIDPAGVPLEAEREAPLPLPHQREPEAADAFRLYETGS